MIHVAVALIVDEQQRILVTQRPLHASHGGCWEFPGGKLEINELPEHALIREVKEEVGLDVLSSQYLGSITHDYVNKSVLLYIFLVRNFSGIPRCIEGQLAMKWLAQNEINPDDFPEANRKVMDMLFQFL